MKLVFFIGKLSNPGGTERVLSIISDGLFQCGHDITIVSLTGEPPAFFPINDRLKVIWLKSRKLNSSILRNLAALCRIVKEIRPDFWIDVDNILGVYSCFLRLLNPGMRWISWEHFNYYYPFAVNQRLRSIARRVCARFADCIVVLSDEDKGYYRERLHIRGRLERIYNPVSFGNDVMVDDAQKEKIVLAAGRLAHVKGFDYLVKVWARLEARFPEWQLLIAGEGEERAALEGMIADAGLHHMTLLGNIRDMREAYRRASIFALPSRGEGFGMVLVEAMSFGIPTVGFGCKAGVREVVPDGEVGFMLDEGDIDGFADKLALLMGDETLRARMGQEARRSVKRFSQQKIVAEWNELLTELNAEG